MLSSTHVVSSKRTSSSRKRNITALLASIAAVPLLGMATRPAMGATLYWDSNGTTPGAGTTPSGVWNTSTFWSTDSTGSSATAAWTTGADAVFSAGTDATGLFTINPSATVSANTITVNQGNVRQTAGTGTVGVTISGAATGTAGLTINSGAKYTVALASELTATNVPNLVLNGGTFENLAAANSTTFLDFTHFKVVVAGTGGTFSCPTVSSGAFLYTPTNTGGITGTGGITFSGNNTAFSLRTPSTYSGPTTITGTGSSSFEFRQSSAAVDNELPTTTDLIINANGLFNTAAGNAQVASLSGAGKVAFGGASKTLTVSGSTNSTFSGVIQDSFTTYGTAAGSTGRLTKSGASILTLSGVNTLTGIVTVNSGSGIIVSSTGKLAGAGADVVVNTGGTLTLNNSAQTIENLTGGGSLVLGTGNTLTSTASANATFTGVISGQGGFTYNGAGFTQTLTGTNTYSGITGVTAGTLITTHPLPTLTSVVVNGGTLNLNGISSTVAGVKLQSGIISGVGTLSSTSAFDIQGGTASSILGGGVGLNKTTAGTATLTNANTYTGDTTITAGKLLVNNTTGSGTGSGNIIVNSSGILAGTGSMSGAVTVNTGGHIATGTGVASGASLTASSVDLKNGSALDFTLGAAAEPFGVNDTLNVTGVNGLNLEAAAATPTLVNIFASASGTYHLINYNTSYLGLVNNGPTSNIQLGTLSGAETATLINNTANHSIDVQVTLADRVWANAGGGDWADGSNWNTIHTEPNGVGVVAEFTNAITSPQLIIISDTDKTVGALKFDNNSSGSSSFPSYEILPTSSQKIIMSTGGPNATITDLNGTQQIDAGLQLNNTTDLTVTNSGDVFTLLDVSGTNGLNKKGAGTLVVSNTYTASGPLNNAGAGDLTMSGVVTGSGGVMNSGPGLLLVSGSVGGSGSVIASAGTIKLLGGNSYTGKTFFNGGQIIPSSDGSLGAVPGSVVADNLTFNGGALTLPSGGLSISANRGINVQSGGGTVNITNSGDVFGYTGVINNSSGGRFTLNGPGKFVASTSMVGSATSSIGISGGATIQFSSSTVFGSQQKIVLDGGTLGFTGTGNGSTFLSGINLEIGASGSGTVSAPDNPDHVTAQSVIFTGSVNGPGTLIKAGDGEWRIINPGGSTNTKLEVDGGFFRVSGTPTVALADTQLGAVPASFVADAVDLKGTGATRSTGGVAIGTSASITTPANRGIKIEAAGASFGTNASWTINSIISGPGSLSVNENGWAPTSSTGNKAGGNFLSLAGINTYGGATNINNAILEASGGQAIPDGSAVTILSATSIAVPATGVNEQAVLRVINGNETIGSLAGGGGTGVTGNPCYGFVVLGTGGSLTTGADDSSTTFSGQITGTGSVTKVGAGTWTIKGFDLANTGATNVNAGILQLGNSAAGLDNASTVNIASAGTFDMNSLVDTIGALAGAGPIINGANLTIAGSNASAVTYSGNYTGTGTLNKSGAGIEILSGSNSFGTVTVSGGVLAVTSSNALGTSGTNNVVLGTGGTLRTDAAFSTIRTITVNTGGGTIDSNGVNSTFANVAGTDTLTKSGVGTVTVNYLRTTGVAVSAGVLQAATVANGGTTSVVSTVTTSGGQLDLNNTKLVVKSGGTPLGTLTGSTYSGVTGQIQNGFAGGAWTGNGIVTSQSNANSSHVLTTLGIDTADDALGVSGGSTAVFGGQTVTNGDVLVMYTYAGDANLTGTINGDDYMKIDAGFASAGALTGYANGDFNYDGKINGDDYFLIDRNYSAQGSPITSPAPGLDSLSAGSGLAGVSAVPEPASLAMIALGVSTLGIRRRRR